MVFSFKLSAAAAAMLLLGSTALQQSRRDILHIAMTSVYAASLPATASSWAQGDYSDPNHPTGFRRITVDEVTGIADVVGRDDSDGPLWRLRAKVVDETLVLELADSPVAPPTGVAVEQVDERLVPTFRGTYSTTPSPSILWPDGNRWTKQIK